MKNENHVPCYHYIITYTYTFVLSANAGLSDFSIQSGPDQWITTHPLGDNYIKQLVTTSSVLNIDTLFLFFPNASGQNKWRDERSTLWPLRHPNKTKLLKIYKACPLH